MTSARAPVLVHGATGFTGKLVCDALKRRGLAFAIGGRNAEKLDALSRELGGVETVVIDLGDAETIRGAIEGRTIVSACAGPFVQVGEPVLATCARLGVHYVDTTGEQRFVADAAARYMATAEASGACVVPAMGYEIAVADWGCALVAKKIGGAPDAIDVAYMIRPVEGGFDAATSRGTKLSAIGMLADPESKQFVDGALVREAPATIVREFPTPSGKAVTCVSFPSPEAVVVPPHTGARTVRTFMHMGRTQARLLQLARAAVPSIVRLTRPLIEKRIASAPVGPDTRARAARFDVVCEARKGARTERVVVSGSDPYGLTGEIQAYAAERALAGDVTAKGVVAPSVGYDAERALRELGLGVS